MVFALPASALADGPAAIATPPVVQATPSGALQIAQPGRYDIRALAVPAGFLGAVALNVDDSGAAYGYGYLDSAQYYSQRRRPIRWTPSGNPVKLGADDATDGAAVGMLNGQPVYWTSRGTYPNQLTNGFIGETLVPGFVPNGIVSGKLYGFKYNSAQRPSNGDGHVHGFGDILPGYGTSVFGMNAAGVVVGTDQVPSHDTMYRMFYGTQGGTYPGVKPFGYFTGVTTDGVAVGAKSTVPTDPHADYHAYRYKPGTAINDDLGTLGGKQSRATAVTPDGKFIVGWSNTADTAMRAFVFWNGRMFDLNTLVDYPVGGDTPVMALRNANGVSNDGKICGFGFASGGRGLPFVASPKPSTGVRALSSAMVSALSAMPKVDLNDLPVTKAPRPKK